MPELILMVNKNKRNKTIFSSIIFLFNIFEACFMFPIIISPTYNFFLTIMYFGLIAIVYIVVIQKKFYVFLISAFCNFLGMVFRYLIEYGEYSNEVNFTTRNIIVDLVIVPLFIVLVHYIAKKLFKW